MALDPIRDRLSLALAAAQDAGDMTLRYYQHPVLDVIAKSDGSPVTPADKEGERIIRAHIRDRFAADAILGEEEGSSDGTSGFRFIIDPIDGTRSFATGIPTFGVLIAVEHQQRIVAGVAHFPALRETLWASSSAGAWWKSAAGHTQRASVLEPPDLSLAHVQTTSPQSYRKHAHDAVHPILASRVARFHGWNDAFSFALAATGRAHAVVGFGFSLWDIAPFCIFFAEAGGLFTDWQGGDATKSMKTILAAAPCCHAALRSVLCTHLST